MPHDAHIFGGEESLIPPLDRRGSHGEQEAARYLQKEKRYRLIAQNWRNPTDHREEIDLVVLDGDILVFVEVKTRSAGARVSGFFCVDAAKKQVLLRACRAYLHLLRRKPRTFRFDVAEVELRPAGPVVRHYMNICLFGRFESAWGRARRT